MSVHRAPRWISLSNVVVSPGWRADFIPNTSASGSAPMCLSYSIPSPLLKTVSNLEEEKDISAFIPVQSLPLKYPFSLKIDILLAILQ